MAKLSEPVLKALETLMECHNNDTKTVVHLIARATKYGNSDEVELLRCANFNDILSALVYSFDLARSAPETTASPSKAVADKGILTEEELKFYEENALGTNYWNMTDALQSVITSHRNLLSANAELSFKNQKYRNGLEKIKNEVHKEGWIRTLVDEALEETK